MPALTAIISGDARPLEKELNRGAAAAQTAAKRIQTALSTDALFLERQISAAKRAGVEWGQYDAQLKKVQVDLAKVNRELATQETLGAGVPGAAAGAGTPAAGGKLLGKIGQGAAHVEGIGGIVSELLVVGREVLNGNFSRVPGSISILVQRLGLLKYAFSAMGAAAAAALAGIVGGFMIFRYRVESTFKALSDYEKTAFNVEHIARYLSAAERTAEAWKDIGAAIKSATEQNEGATASAQRQLEIIKELYRHRRVALEHDKANALVNVHDPKDRAYIEKTFAQLGAGINKEERDAEVANMEKERQALLKESQERLAEAAAIKVPSAEAEAERGRAIAQRKTDADKYMEEQAQKDRALIGAGTTSYTGGEMGSRPIAFQDPEKVAAVEAAWGRLRSAAAAQKEDFDFRSSQGDAGRLRARQEELNKGAATDKAAAAVLAENITTKKALNRLKDKNEASEANDDQILETTRKGAGLPTLTHNQHIGAYIGGPSVALLTEAKTTNRHLNSIDRKLGSMNRLTPVGKSSDVHYGHP